MDSERSGEPVGAWGPCGSGWDDVSRTFDWVASHFSDCTAYDFELVAAGVGPV